ncbi:phospholipase A2 [Ophiocordyceps camponoti-floridani]|uniref:Phospholipase A2 n=1 Tax=Ophiocordyceps camponoti-floridani TaxID=2030778 RepID=A0A8H4VDV7_9HYPO|nr:phospholipase A2 [Ophiocordyceps camponoti-floridani]
MRFLTFAPLCLAALTSAANKANDTNLLKCWGDDIQPKRLNPEHWFANRFMYQYFLETRTYKPREQSVNLFLKNGGLYEPINRFFQPEANNDSIDLTSLNFIIINKILSPIEHERLNKDGTAHLNRDAVRMVVDFFVFNTTMEQFQLLARSKIWKGFDWKTDACTASPDKPYGYDFKWACIRHDFGYRNFRRLGMLSHNWRRKTDMNFLMDMKDVCDASKNPKGCIHWVAKWYYIAVRVFGLTQVQKVKRSLEPAEMEAQRDANARAAASRLFVLAGLLDEKEKGKHHRSEKLDHLLREAVFSKDGNFAAGANWTEFLAQDGAWNLTGGRAAGPVRVCRDGMKTARGCGKSSLLVA